RVVGACPGEKVTRRVENAITGAVETLGHCGPVLIGATDTRAASDPGVKVASVPEMEIYLQRLETLSRAPQVFGTIPTNASSKIHDDRIIISESNELTVSMHQDLERALLMPGADRYIWNEEVHGVIKFARETLMQHPNSVYHAVFVGGGSAT